MSELIIPYEFGANSTPSIDNFKADVQAVEDFYNGSIDNSNIKNTVITAGKLTSSCFSDEHLEDGVLTSSYLSQSPGNRITHDKIEPSVIGVPLVTPDLYYTDNVRSIFTAANTNYQIRILTGTTPLMDLNAVKNTTLHYDWSAICYGGAAFNTIPQLIFPEFRISSGDCYSDLSVAIMAVALGYVEFRICVYSANPTVSVFGYITFTIVDYGGF